MPALACGPYNGLMINQQRTGTDPFVAALARRDFGAMGTCLAPGTRFRALLPATSVRSVRSVRGVMT
jgi:hypothetical protein